MAKTGSVSDGRFRADVTVRIGSVAVELHGAGGYRVHPVPLLVDGERPGSAAVDAGRVAALDRALFGGGDDCDADCDPGTLTDG